MKGAYHIGAIKALQECGYEIGGYVGTSIGAFNAAVLAQGDYKKLYDAWYNGSTALGIDVDEREFEFVKTLALTFRFVDIYYLKKDIDIQEIVIQEEEVEKVKWATSSEIEQLIQEGKFQKTHKLVYEEILKYLDK